MSIWIYGEGGPRCGELFFKRCVTFSLDFGFIGCRRDVLRKFDKMAKILPIERDGKQIGWCLKCPACGCGHKFCTVDAHDEGWPVWTLTGMPHSPTIRDSLLFKGGDADVVCHSFVTDGRISYAGDSTHALRNQTVDLPDFD